MKTLVIVIGNAGSGKTTASDTIIKLAKDKGRVACNVKFAAPLYKLHNLFFNTKRRWFLLLLGNIIDKFKLRRFICKTWYNKVREEFTTKNRDIIICDDLRFPEECDIVYQLGVEGVYQQLIVLYINTDIDICLDRSGNTIDQMKHNTESHTMYNWRKLDGEYGPLLILDKHIIYYGIILPNNDSKEIYKNAIINYIGGKI